MIHLFNKVYITYAESSVGPDAFDKISEHYIQIIDRGIEDIRNEYFDNKKIFYGKSLEEVFEFFGSEKDFFEKVRKKLSHLRIPKIIIYADEFAFNEILIRWWKGLFPHLSSDSAYALYLNFKESENIRQTQSENFLNISVDSRQIRFDQFADLYWGMNKDKFNYLYNSLEAFNIEENIREQCSLEFKVMNYLNNSEFKYRDNLVHQFSSLYKKRFVEEVDKIKRGMQEDLYYIIEEDQELAAGSSLNDISLTKLISNNHKYSFLLDTKINKSKDCFTYLQENYDLWEIVKTLLEADRKILIKFGLDENNLKADNPCLSYFHQNKSHPDMLDILDEEVKGRSQFSFLRKFAQNRKINPYLIPAYKNLLSSEDPKSKKLSQEFTL
jgi:hypothetical protein